MRMSSPFLFFVSHRSTPVGPARTQLGYDLEAPKPAAVVRPLHTSHSPYKVPGVDQTIYSLTSCLSFTGISRVLNSRGKKNCRAAPIKCPHEQDQALSHLQRRFKLWLTWPLVTMFACTFFVIIFYLDFADIATQSFLKHFRYSASVQSAVFADFHFVGLDREMTSLSETVDCNHTGDPQRGAWTVVRRKALNVQLGVRFWPGYLLQGFHLGRMKSNTTREESKNLSTESLPVQPHSIKLQDEVYHNLTHFTKSYEAMEKGLKIYVYQDGYKPMVHGSKMTGVYATEGLFLKRIEEPGNRFTVADPSKALLFLLPYSVRQMVIHLQDPYTDSMQTLKTYVANYVERAATKYPFWNRTHGADHFFVSCHDWAPASTKNHVELHQNAMMVVCNADLTKHFDVDRDVSIPQTLGGNQPHLGIGNLGPDERDFLAFYAGQMHGMVRPVLINHWKDKDPEMKVYEVLPPSIAVNISYVQHMKRSKFCLCPKGYEVSSPRIVEAILNECVPVIISDNFVLPFSDVLDWSKFSITVPEKDIPDLKKILTSVPEDTYRSMQRRLKYVRRHFLWLKEPEDTKYDSFHMILYSIWRQSLNIHKRMAKPAPLTQMIS